MKDIDKSYDEFVDRVICSEDFKNCKYKNQNDECMPYYREYYKFKLCWYIKECPKGYLRK